jgi:hypothetical protein
MPKTWRLPIFLALEKKRKPNNCSSRADYLCIHWFLHRTAAPIAVFRGRFRLRASARNAIVSRSPPFHQAGFVIHHIDRMRSIIVLAALAAALPLAGHALPPASAGTVRFDDSAYGVSFRYSVAWTRSNTQPFMFPLAISTTANSQGRSSLRAFVFSKSIPDVASWPATNFAGVEFGYAARPAAREEVCQALARANDSHVSGIGNATIHGVSYWHATAGDGGMSKSISDDIYATWIPKRGGSCLLFDLAVQSVLAPGDTPLRPLTPREQSLIHRSLQDVLSSIRIFQPSQPSEK